jgi:hypothetical protein
MRLTGLSRKRERLVKSYHHEGRVCDIGVLGKRTEERFVVSAVRRVLENQSASGKRQHAPHGTHYEPAAGLG